MGDPRPTHEQRRRTGRGIGRTEAASRGRAIGEAGLGPVYRIYLIHPTIQIKRVLIDSSNLRIKHLNSKTVAFRRDLHICGLRSTIQATIQKVKFFINSGASFFFWCYILPPKKNSSSNSAASTVETEEKKNEI
jgi:hypothetical protein